jgi:carboxypeptidase C (cathepsin A)
MDQPACASLTGQRLLSSVSTEIRMSRFCALIVALVLASSLPVPSALLAQPASTAQQGREDQPRSGPEASRRERASEPTKLPPQVTTRHSLELPGRILKFMATTGALTLTDPQGNPVAEYGFTSYALDGADPSTRTVTFVINGGPGASSAYLHLLALGPWRLPLDDQRISPSASPALVPNDETWLDFTDLVFIDPPGTGYARIIGGDQVRERFYSVEGDIDGLAAFVMRWLKEKDRLQSPKAFVGESYGGFRGPLLAQKLQSDLGAGLSTVVLISPVLDFGWFSQPGHSPWVHATRLPSMAAAALARRGSLSREALRDVEQYASSEYLVDLMKGLQDTTAVDRLSKRVSEFTGLDRDLVRRLAGRIEPGTFQREFRRGSSEVVSAYDTDVRSADPDPTAAFSRFEDPGLTGMTAPLTSAIVDHLSRALSYPVEGRRFELLNGDVNGAWRWGRGRGQPESLQEMRRALALDGKFRVLVAHGYTDLVTPYFASQLLLNQLPPLGPEPRVSLEVFEGGHMFYSRGASRRAFREVAQRTYSEALRARNTEEP